MVAGAVCRNVRALSGADTAATVMVVVVLVVMVRLIKN